MILFAFLMLDTILNICMKIVTAKIAVAQCHCLKKAYTDSEIRKANKSKIHMYRKFFVIASPHLIGMVVHPYFLSPT